MALDGIILHKIALDLTQRLPFRINRISEISPSTLVFNIHSQNERTNLIISCHSLYNRLHISAKTWQYAATPSSFTMLLRKHLLNGVIDKIEQFAYDRYLLLHIRTLDDLYDAQEFTLCVELMGKYANLILINKENKIVDALKKITPQENSLRIVLPNVPFTTVKQFAKKDPFKSDLYDPDQSLVKQFAGFSPLLEKEVQYRLNHQSFAAIMAEIQTSTQLYLAFNNREAYFHVIPLTHTGLSFKAYPLNEGLDLIYGELEEKERIRSLTDDLFKFTKRMLKHYQTKLKKLKENQIIATKADYLKLYGDLLYMHGNLSLKGLNKISCRDYEQNTVEIELEPKLDLKANANRYYNLYQKRRKSLKYLAEQLEIAGNELEYFEAIAEQLAIANYHDALMIKDELIRLNYLKSTTKVKLKNKKLHHLYSCTYGGYRLTFGKNNSQNEILTFAYAKKSDLWFHAQGYHGAHLIIEAASAPEDVLRYAANLAAWFSQGRYSSSVPVDYCQVKDVKKIKGAKSGFVRIQHQKTIYIDPVRVDESNLTLI